MFSKDAQWVLLKRAILEHICGDDGFQGRFCTIDIINLVLSWLFV
jgi:hypothetical protein